jgi:hypothetical protein
MAQQQRLVQTGSGQRLLGNDPGGVFSKRIGDAQDRSEQQRPADVVYGVKCPCTFSPSLIDSSR